MRKQDIKTILPQVTNPARISLNLHYGNEEIWEVIYLLLPCFCSRYSHYHLQGQSGGGGAPRGEGGHHRLRVDGLLSLLRVHAQHRHFRQGQVAGKTAIVALLDARLCMFAHPTGQMRPLTHKEMRR